ncbi:MAG: hypothetical protein WC939_01265 [Acholeplasmataceae bacterium]
MDKFTNAIVKVGSFLLNPIKIISNTNIPDKFFTFLNKNAWVKVLLSFIIMVIIIVVWYVMTDTQPVS